jgi:HAD superfamily hydrolase (TIGR01509 family)
VTAAADGSRPFDPTGIELLLCDADGNLFPSEEPAFAASADVTNRCLAELGVPWRIDSEQLRRQTTGKSFRTTIVDLAREGGKRLAPGDLERWVAEERRVVTAHLGTALRPDAETIAALTRLGERFGLAVVSSSALERLAACFSATGLDALFPPERRFSAEDSLERPASKPDPAIYRFAAHALGARDGAAVAIEDSVAGVQSAVAAGLVAIGNVAHVASAERGARVAALHAAGAATVVASWSELEAL